MKSRPLQLVLLLALFVAGVVTFRGCADSGSPETASSEGYIPPSP